LAAAPAAAPLSPSATVSLLTCSPVDDDVYTLYGHTAIRVCDTAQHIDAVFNYGIFDFSKPNFIYRFAKGETDYMLRAYNFSAFMQEYVLRGSEIAEQRLNLSPQEREALWQALVLNERPENRVYRYNFFFDNCATRPAAMIEKHLNGKLLFASVDDEPSFRDVINYCTRNHPWVTFGCNLVLGLPTDRKMTFRERFFLPAFVRDAFDMAMIDSDGCENYLVAKRVILNEADMSEEEKDAAYKCFWSPMLCGWLFFAVILLITVIEWRQRRRFVFIDCLCFFLAGCAGCVLYFLCFLSVHPCIFPNLSVLWLHPFHFIGVAVCLLKKPVIYHTINLFAIIFMLILWFFVPQYYDLAFTPLISALLLRSVTCVVCTR